MAGAFFIAKRTENWFVDGPEQTSLHLCRRAHYELAEHTVSQGGFRLH
jgi:hypothetical protein